MSKVIKGRSGAFVALGVIAALTLIGCGDPDRPADATGVSETGLDETVDVVAPPGAAVRQAAAKSAEQPTVQVWIRITRNG